MCGDLLPVQSNCTTHKPFASRRFNSYCDLYNAVADLRWGFRGGGRGASPGLPLILGNKKSLIEEKPKGRKHKTQKTPFGALFVLYEVQWDTELNISLNETQSRHSNRPISPRSKEGAKSLCVTRDEGKHLFDK